MLSERLKSALEHAAQLPPEVQDKVAAHFELAITNAQWDADLNYPANDLWLSEWITEAQADEIPECSKPWPETCHA